MKLCIFVFFHSLFLINARTLHDFVGHINYTVLLIDWSLAFRFHYN